MKSAIAEAKHRLPLPALLHREGLGDHAKKSARCPLHDDRRNSFSIYRNDGNEWRWKCFARCGSGDEITFLELHRGISRSDATKLFLDMAGVNGSTQKACSASPGVRQRVIAAAKGRESGSSFDWQKCVDAFTEEHQKHLADWRGYSLEFCSWLHEQRLVGLHDGCIAFPVHDRAGNVVAAHCRKKDGSWFYYPQGAKVRPLVIGESLPGDTVHIFESQWDAFAFMAVSGERHGIIVTRGASNGALVADVIPDRATVYVWPQNDAPGEKWAKDVCGNTKATVKRVRIPSSHKDANDWARTGATVAQLLAAMNAAETLREAEKSWDDALSESVVTANELHHLHLTQRRKLLGDWFAEGDLGFIFAFRGVGKTWLALAVAQALSTGGRLGDWQAHAPVKVLYVDGEMPPDLMRARTDGLEAANDNLHFLSHDILFERTGKVLNITRPEVQQAITQRCLASAIKVLFLDNLSTLACGMKENEADSWELVNNWLLDLRRRKIAVVIVHHAGRSGEMRGTTKREDNVFWIIALDDAKRWADDKRGARFISHFTKPSRNTQEEVPTYEWRFVTEASGVVTISHAQAQTLDVFRQLIEEGVCECVHIASEMKTSPATVSRLAKKASDAGWLTKKGREYRIIDAAESAPDATAAEKKPKAKARRKTGRK
jgi:hypothetical protein